MRFWCLVRNLSSPQHFFCSELCHFLHLWFFENSTLLNCKVEKTDRRGLYKRRERLNFNPQTRSHTRACKRSCTYARMYSRVLYRPSALARPLSPARKGNKHKRAVDYTNASLFQHCFQRRPIFRAENPFSYI